MSAGLASHAGPVAPVTDANFAEMVLGSDIPVLVDFWAPWCGPCLMVAPVLKKIAEEHAGQLRVVSLNADENPVTTMERSVLAMPTLQLYVAGELVTQIVGARPKSALIRELSSYLPSLAEHVAG
jgi:thioredoxin 1